MSGNAMNYDPAKILLTLHGKREVINRLNTLKGIPDELKEIQQTHVDVLTAMIVRLQQGIEHPSDALEREKVLKQISEEDATLMSILDNMFGEDETRTRH